MKSDRKQFIRVAARGGVATVLAALSVRLFRQTPLGSGRIETCIDPKSHCAGCQVFKKCGLPRALSVKAFRRKEDQKYV